jgi:phosphatidate cytidylyltransferase
VKRIATAALLIPLLLAVIKFLDPWAFFALGALFGLVATLELCRLLAARGWPCQPWLAAGGATALAATFLMEHSEPAAPLMALLLVSTTAAMFRERDPVRAANAVPGTLFAALIVGLTLGYLVGLRVGSGNDELGQDLLLFSFAVIWLSDTAAYYGGKSLGRRRLFIRVSPGKTWEGAAFGLLGSLAGALLAHHWFFQRLLFPHWLILAVLLFLTGILGDLVESVQKRAAAAKDSGGLLPGHGGVLDRLDSFLFAAPALYYYHRYFLTQL